MSTTRAVGGEVVHRGADAAILYTMLLRRPANLESSGDRALDGADRRCETLAGRWWQLQRLRLGSFTPPLGCFRRLILLLVILPFKLVKEIKALSIITCRTFDGEVLIDKENVPDCQLQPKRQYVCIHRDVLSRTSPISSIATR